MDKKIMVIAGEASGDLHGANLIRHLREVSPELEIFGVGGERIRATGALDFFDLAHFHATGFTEALRRVPDYRAAERTLLDNMDRRHPHLVVLIDNPGFNLHLAAKIHARGIPIVYYITPQLWAWAPKRIFKIKRYVKKAVVVFEFEKTLFESHGIPVEWVGHPLKDLIPAAIGAPRPRKLALLPGSRKHEVETLLKIFLGAAAILKSRFVDLSVDLIQSPTLDDDFYKKLLKSAPVKVRPVRENTYEAIGSSALALACSGTATLECALLETPMIISNRASFVTYALAKSLIRLPYIGLPNIVLGEKKFPEFLQYDATPGKIAAEAVQILGDSDRQKQLKEDLKEVSRRLGPPGANRRAAEAVLKALE